MSRLTALPSESIAEPSPFGYGHDYPEPAEWEMDPHGTPPPPPPPYWADVAAFLEGGIPEPPRPVCLRREDGHALFYAGKVNVLFGDPESGKSWIAYAAVTQCLQEGRKAAIIDVDHNGIREVVSRLVKLGAPQEALADPELFRYCEPEDGMDLLRTVSGLRDWRPACAVVDSIGEVMPMLNLSSNSPDDYSNAHRAVLTALSNVNTCVIAVDHMPKSEDARERGQTGTMAKKRAVNGATYRVTVKEQFAPGRGGTAALVVVKDRPGGVREVCPSEGKYTPAGLFVMVPDVSGALHWKITAPRITDGAATANDDDMATLDGLDPPPKSKRDVQERCSWGSNRATEALSRWRELRSS
jgi:hypothetical protein